MAIDVSVLLAELAPMLNAASTADADFLFWTQAELYQFADDAIKEAARKSLCFAALPSAVTTSAASTALPQGSIAVIAAAWNNAPLRETNVPELEALDDAWTAATGTPVKWLDDVGVNIIRVYPAPSAAGSLSVAVQAFPLAIGSTQTTVEAPAPFAGYLLEAILGRARGKQSDAMMPEIAEHCAQRAAMYQQIFSEYWGAGE